MGDYNHSLSADATIMVSNECPMIGEHVAVIFLSQYVTITIVYRSESTLNLGFKCK